MARRVDVEKRLLARNFKPVRKDGVFVLYDEVPFEVATPTGIIVPGGIALQQRMDRSATVVGVGKKVHVLKRGSRVLLSKVYGTAIPHDDDRACTLKYVSEDQVDAMLEGPGEAEDYDHYAANL